MGNDPTMVTMRERVRVVKVDLDHPENPPEIIEQQTVHRVSLDDAALMGFSPGKGFASDAEGHAPQEGVKVGDE